MLIKKLYQAILLMILPVFILSNVANAASLQIPSKVQSETNIIPAQISIDFGGDEREIRRRLRRAGYSQIRFTKKGFTKIRAEACFDGTRYRVSIKRLGFRVRREGKIGTCRTPLTFDEVMAKLKTQGYSRISITEIRGGRYEVIACRRSSRDKLIINRFGETKDSKSVGRCRKGGRFDYIVLSLRDEGFNRIKLIERDGRRFIVEACQRNTKYRLRVNPAGRILRERRIGRCQPPIRVGQIIPILKDRGFNRIKIIDDQIPFYRAEACRDNNRFEVTLSRFGQIFKVDVIGECEPPIAKKDVFTILKKRGVNRIQITKSGPAGFVAQGCNRLERMEYRIDPYGAVLKRSVIGRCTPPPRVGQVLRDFRVNKKLRDVGIFVEGCRKGKLLRFEIDRFGEVLKEERIGRCR